MYYFKGLAGGNGLGCGQNLCGCDTYGTHTYRYSKSHTVSTWRKRCGSLWRSAFASIDEDKPPGAGDTSIPERKCVM